ncbi:MAG: acyltransferase [Haloferacaceae archaeon]
MKRHVELPPDAREAIDRAVGYVDRRLSSDEETAAVVRDLLVDLFGDRPAYERYRATTNGRGTTTGRFGDRPAYERYRAGGSISPLARVRLRSYDPRNVLVETEHWAEQDLADLREAKCLQFLWRGFDCSPLAHNVAFALPFRRVLATHLFDDVGEGVKLFGGIKIQCGHNIEIGDHTVVHNDVLLDDRGRLTIGDRVSIADRSHLHTHHHDLADQADVTHYRTVVADDARLGYDAMVGAGSRVGENAMVGASAMVRGDVPDHHVAVGAPAKTVKVKPGWESVADAPGPLPDNREDRRLERDIPDDLDPIDEFGRDLSPPGDA